MSKKTTVLLVCFICIAVGITGAVIIPMLRSPGSSPGSSGDGNQQPALESYIGTLTAGNSLFHNGEAIVELTFKDSRGFIASEQMAKQANMKVGGTYRITFNSTAPTVAVSIQEVLPP